MYHEFIGIKYTTCISKQHFQQQKYIYKSKTLFKKEKYLSSFYPVAQTTEIIIEVSKLIIMANRTKKSLKKTSTTSSHFNIYYHY